MKNRRTIQAYFFYALLTIAMLMASACSDGQDDENCKCRTQFKEESIVVFLDGTSTQKTKTSDPEDIYGCDLETSKQWDLIGRKEGEDPYGNHVITLVYQIINCY
jgi:hypothetical protein